MKTIYRGVQYDATEGRYVTATEFFEDQQDAIDFSQVGVHPNNKHLHGADAITVWEKSEFNNPDAQEKRMVTMALSKLTQAERDLINKWYVREREIIK